MVLVIEGKQQRCGDGGGGGDKTIEMWWRLHAVEEKKQKCGRSKQGGGK